MKYMVAILAVLATASTMHAFKIPDFGKGELHQDFQDFINLIPMDDVVAIVLEYAAEDEEFQAAYAYMMSEEFQKLVVDIESIPEVKELIDYLENAGIEAKMILEKLNEFLGIPDDAVPRYFTKLQKISGGLRGLVDDIMAVVPKDKIKELYYYKLEHSKAFANFIAELSSPAFQKIVNAVYANPRFQELLQNAKAAGLDLLIVKELLHKLLGIEVPTDASVFISELDADFLDFLALIPTEKIVEIVTRYVTEDEQVQKALEYAQSKEFEKMVFAVENLKEYQQLVLYMYNNGIDIFRYIQGIHDMLGFDDYVPPVQARITTFMATGGIRAMIDEIKAILPIEDIKALYYKKLETSKAFADFINLIKSDSFQKIVDSLYTHEIFLQMLDAASNAGLDIVAIGDFFSTVFGLKFPEH